MYWVYILYSKKRNRYYIGQTQNLTERLQRHISGRSVYTKNKQDWKLVYTESFNSREDTLRREREIKRKKSRKYIEQLVNVGA